MLKTCVIVAAACSPVLAQPTIRAVPLRPDQRRETEGGSQDGFVFDLDWYTVDGGGASYLNGSAYEFGVTIGQPDAGPMFGGDFEFGGGFWYGVGVPSSCYANCDGSTGTPALTSNDFQCFLNKFAAGDPYANCDGSTGTPALTSNDFQCFLNKFASGCS